MILAEQTRKGEIERDILGETLFGLLGRYFALAVSRVGLRERTFCVGGRLIRLRFAGEGDVAGLTRALTFISEEAEFSGGLTVEVWDGETSGLELPEPFHRLVETVAGSWWNFLTPGGEIRGVGPGRYRAGFHPGPNFLSLLDVVENHAVYWRPRATELPYYEIGSPMRALFHWWFREKGGQYIHAGAVGTPELGAAVLVGKGGSGKSSTALACLLGGMRYIGDDYCLATQTGGPTVHHLYGTAKLKGPADLERFPELADAVTNRHRLADQKALLFVNELFPERIARELPARVLLIPRVTGEKRTLLRQAGVGAALQALAPSTMFQLSGAVSEDFKRLTALVKSLPCRFLDLGTDRAEIVETVRFSLEEATRA